MTTINFKNLDGNLFAFNIDRLPDVCPICHCGIKPVKPDWNHIRKVDGFVPSLEMIFLCPIHSCNHLFLARYRQETDTAFYLDRCFPQDSRDLKFSPEIQKISPDFCSIYNQAQKAEALGLMLVSGPGYRKALEFLIKDYVTSLHTTDEESKKDIASSQLMPVIKKYVKDERTNKTAVRATWLGNDETHYVRRWIDKDLQDMKNLINLTCNWIEAEHLTKEIVSTMPEGKKP